jgi:hypothetical protein
MKNIIIKGDGTIQTGIEIIEIFQKLGGKNTRHYHGGTSDYYYIYNNQIFKDIKTKILLNIHEDSTIIYNSLQEYLNSFNKIINYNDI